VEKVAQQVSDSTPSGLNPGVKMGKQRKYLVLAPLAAITASGTQLQQPQPTHECIVGLGLGGVWRWNTSDMIHISVY
jgi:hypothetical protein